MVHISVAPDEVIMPIATILSRLKCDFYEPTSVVARPTPIFMGTGNHFSAGRSLGNATIAPAPVVPVAGADLSPPLPTTVSDVGRNGLRLKVWPQLVNGLTGDAGNFTIRIVDPACDPEDGCAEIGDEVCDSQGHSGTQIE